MCKMKDTLLRAKAVRTHYHINFMEQLYTMMTKQLVLTKSDIDDMEKGFNKSIILSNTNISKISLNN